MYMKGIELVWLHGHHAGTVSRQAVQHPVSVKDSGDSKSAVMRWTLFELTPTFGQKERQDRMTKTLQHGLE